MLYRGLELARGWRNRWAAPGSLPGTAPGWCPHPAVPSTGQPGIPALLELLCQSGTHSLLAPGPWWHCQGHLLRVPCPLSVPTVRGSASQARAWCLPAPHQLELSCFRFVLYSKINFYTPRARTPCPVSAGEQSRTLVPAWAAGGAGPPWPGLPHLMAITGI